MGKIKYLDFAKSMENETEYLKDVLKVNKNLPDVEDSKSLRHYIEDVKRLPEYNSELQDKYIPDPYFIQFEEDYNNDPLRTKNGGEYKDCVFVLLTNRYLTSFISRNSLNSANETHPHLIKTSDGQELIITKSQDVLITWNDTPENLITLQDGTKCRWIKLYGNERTVYGSGKVIPAYETSKPTQYTSPVIMCIFDYGKEYTIYSNQSSSDSDFKLSRSLEYMILGDNVTQIGRTGSDRYFLYGCSALKALKAKNPIDFYGHSSFSDCYNIIEIDIKFNSIFSGETSPVFNFASPKHITINLSDCNINILGCINITSNVVSYNVSNIKYILPDIINRYGGIQLNSEDKVYNIVASEDSNQTIIIKGGYFTKKVSIKYNFENSLNLSSCFSLFEQSIKNIFINLKDLTGEMTKNIIFSMYLQKKIEPLIELATNKNWTVSFV